MKSLLIGAPVAEGVDAQAVDAGHEKRSLEAPRRLVELEPGRDATGECEERRTRILARDRDPGRVEAIDPALRQQLALDEVEERENRDRERDGPLRSV